MPSWDDLSDLGPPVTNNTGRLYILVTAVAFVFVTAHTQRPLSLRLLVTGLVASDIYLLLTMPGIMGHIAGFDPLIANFICADLMRVTDLYFLRDHSKELKKKNDDFVDKTLRDGKVHGGKANGKNPDRGRIAKFPPMTTFQAFDYLIMNHRNIGTPYKARNIPHFDDSSPSYVPSRANFLLRKFVTIFLAYGLLDLLTCQAAPHPWLYSLEQESFFTRLHDVTWEEIQFRIITNLNLWASTYLLIQYIFAIVAFVAVGTTIYSPSDFPPLVGSPRHCYSIRNWWSKFWHQVLQSPLTSNANALTALLLPASLQRSTLARYSKVFFSFALSGVSHAVSPLGSTKGSQQIRGTIFFFPAQVIGIAIEDLVVGVYRRVVGKGEKDSARGWEKAIGFVWVMCWMSWCCPIWVYPTLRRGGEGMVPYSFIRNGFNGKEIWDY